MLTKVIYCIKLTIHIHFTCYKGYNIVGFNVGTPPSLLQCYVHWVSTRTDKNTNKKEHLGLVFARDKIAFGTARPWLLDPMDDHMLFTSFTYVPVSRHNIRILLISLWH